MAAELINAVRSVCPKKCGTVITQSLTVIPAWPSAICLAYVSTKATISSAR